MPHLCDLPEELILEIFKLVDAKTLVQSFSVCRMWKDLIRVSAELQYSIELWADGMIAGPNTEPAAELLEALLARRRAWSHLDSMVQTVIPIDQHSPAYDLVHGVFAQQSGAFFTAVQLPSTADPTTFHLRSQELGIAPQDFVMDPTQDLVAFLYQDDGDGLKLTCRSLASLQTHPFAAAPILELPMQQPFSLTMEVAEDMIGVFVRFSPEILILDWQRGTVVQNIDPGPHITTYNFLSPRAYILGNTRDSGHLEIWKFGYNGRTHVATLQLPQIAVATMVNISAHSNAFRAKPTIGKRWCTSNRRLCVLSLDYELDEDIISYDLFLHHRYLLNYLSTLEGPTTVVWDQWGPRHSRIVRGLHHGWLRYVHGELVVLPRDPQDPHVLTILDFGLIASRDDRAHKTTSELCTSPNTISNPRVYRDDVSTNLPYRRTQHTFAEDHAFFMIDEEHIIGVNDLETQLFVYTI